MTKYELLLVLPGTLDEKEAENRSNEILSVVKEYNGEAEISSIGKMRLAYPIKQIRYGYFYTIIFSVESKELKAVQEKLGLMRDLLRAIISVYNPNYTPASKLTFTSTFSNTFTTTSGTNMVNEEMVEVEKPKAPVEKSVDKKVSIQDIDKKLDEILAGEIISGV
ncbi:MAG: 30S ribosomal protein S6 [Candidatus Magasanikbacteria bacterium]|jgi:ribosomal protein S6